MACMSRIATAIELSDEDRMTLESWVRRGCTQQRYLFRARIILAAAQGQETKEIAAAGIAGLQDAPRPGKPRKYDESDERRILTMLDQDPPIHLRQPAFPGLLAC